MPFLVTKRRKLAALGLSLVFTLIGCAVCSLVPMIHRSYFSTQFDAVKVFGLEVLAGAVVYSLFATFGILVAKYPARKPKSLRIKRAVGWILFGLSFIYMRESANNEKLDFDPSLDFLLFNPRLFYLPITTIVGQINSESTLSSLDSSLSHCSYCQQFFAF